MSLADFQKIAGAGFNTVRIPIGYWAFEKYGGDPYIQGAQDYLDQGIAWARQTGLKVWIDLHGAPRSQNGFDNSGQRIDNGNPGWTSSDTIDFTQGVFDKIAKKYATSDYADVVSAIEAVNEPLMSKLPGGRDAVSGYTQSAYQSVRSRGATGFAFSDGFANPSSWNRFPAGQSNSLVDHHEYQVFSCDFQKMSYQDHNNYVCTSANTWAGGADKPVIVGEWTAAMTDCAAALNGYGIGSRYEGLYPKDGCTTRVGNCYPIQFIDQWDQARKDGTKAYIETQMNVFEQKAQGWIFWNFKTEQSPEWDLFKLLDAGIFPQPLSSRSAGGLC